MGTPKYTHWDIDDASKGVKNRKEMEPEKKKRDLERKRKLRQQKSIKAPGKIIANTESVNRTMLVSVSAMVTGPMDKKRAKVS